jgi:DNA repair exonuclease SbcCD nuclease subunit
VERGANLRERDVAAAFERAVQASVRIAPDVVVVAGDVFDRPDPPPGAVVALARGLEALRSSLPEAPVLMVAGPRDTPRRPGDPGALAVLDTFPNVEAATSLTRSILMERLDLHACLVPYRATVRHPAALPESDPKMRWNLLVIHGSTDSAGESGVYVDPEEWDYIALGGEHRRGNVIANAQYPGSLERVALDPWDEATDEKGFLTVDLERDEVVFHAIPGRPVVALAPIKVVSGDAERLRRRVQEVMAEVPGGIDGKIVRLSLQGASPEDLLALQGDLLAGLRRRALHLAVEAGKELRVPPAAWLPVDAPGLLRDALEGELERDGLLAERTRAVIAELVSDDLVSSLEREPVGALDSLDGDVPGVGRVSTSLPKGLTGVIGGGAQARQAVEQLLVREAGAGSSGPLRHLWSGHDAETLEESIAVAIEAVAASRGLATVDAALLRAGEIAAVDPVTSVTPVRLVERPEGGAVHVDLEQVAAEFRSAESDLRGLRADVVEVDGDLEVATMGWLRERQDAETTLNAYRDRAREVRARLKKLEAAGPDAPCPTCGRVLQSHYQDVLTELNEEWESVVQDGSWWKSRWDQLEPKPSHLQELEGQSLRLHAALEAGSEGVELLRSRLSDLSEREVVSVPPTRARGAFSAVVHALRRLRSVRSARATDLLLDRSSRFLCRISGGRILTVSLVAGRATLNGDRGLLGLISEEDRATARIAVRLAAASLVAAGGRLLGSLVLAEPFDRLDIEGRIRTLVLVKELLDDIPRVILFSSGEAVDARPELFDCILEVRDEASGVGPVLRPAAAGPGRTLLRAPAKPARGTAPFRDQLSS